MPPTDDINPKSGGFIDDYLLYLMAHASAAASQAFHAELAKEGVSVPTWRILGSLYPDKVLNVGTLARESLMKQPTLTRQLDKICQSGLVTRQHEDHDRRGVLVSLTDEGRRRAKRYIEKAHAHEAEILADYPAEEVQDLKSKLRELILRSQSGD